MPKVTVAVPFTGDPAQVVAKTRQVIEHAVQDFQGQQLDIQWSERSAQFKFTSLGFPIDGQARVEDRQVVVEVDLPMAAMMFKERVQEAITKGLQRALAGP